MLVLSRQRDESVFIDGERIVVTVVDIRGDKVRLGFTGPAECPIHREEVYRAIVRNGGEIKQPNMRTREEIRDAANLCRASLDLLSPSGETAEKVAILRAQHAIGALDWACGLDTDGAKQFDDLLQNLAGLDLVEWCKLSAKKEEGG